MPPFCNLDLSYLICHQIFNPLFPSLADQYLISYTCISFLPSATVVAERLCCYRYMSVHSGEVYNPPGRHPPGQTPTPLAETPLLWSDPPPRDGHCSGRYASYWNALLLENFHHEIQKTYNTSEKLDQMLFNCSRFTYKVCLIVKACYSFQFEPYLGKKYTQVPQHGQ